MGFGSRIECSGILIMEFLNNLLDTIRGVAPTVAGSLVGGATGNPIIGGAVASIVRGVLGKPDDGSPIRESEAQEIIKNPQMYLQLRTMLQDAEIQELKEETKRMEITNQTMQVESRSESKAQRGWRPFNGFLFGITLFCDYVVSQIILALAESSNIWNHVPPGVYVMWAGLLGVSAGSRGVEKIAKVSPAAGVVGIIKSSFGK